MKTNDLRIGNLVLNDDGGVCKLFNIHEGYINHKPIPLTEEWLLKFGFETQPRKNDLDQWFYIEKGKFSMNNARGFWSHSPIYLEDVIEILYVHTLQNLYFALTGEELEVKQ